MMNSVTTRNSEYQYVSQGVWSFLMYELVQALVFSMIIVRAQNGRTRTISGPLRSSIRFWWGDPCETASTSRDGGTAMPPGMEIHLNNVERAEMGDGKSYRSRTEVELIAPPDSKICVNC